MSKTRTFKIGHVEAFQDKPSSETRLAIERIHKLQEERLRGINCGKHILSLVDEILKIEDANLSTEEISKIRNTRLSDVLQTLVRKTNL